MQPTLAIERNSGQHILKFKEVAQTGNNELLYEFNQRIIRLVSAVVSLLLPCLFHNIMQAMRAGQLA